MRERVKLRRRLIAIGVTFVTFLGITGPSALADGTKPTAPRQDGGGGSNAPSPTGDPPINADEGWQRVPVLGSTGGNLEQGGRFTINVAGGRWSVQVPDIGFVGPAGYDREDLTSNPDRMQGCELLGNFRPGALLGRVSGGAVFAVTSGQFREADASGALELRINEADRCLTDNSGAINVEAMSFGVISVPGQPSTGQRPNEQDVREIQQHVVLLALQQMTQYGQRICEQRPASCLQFLRSATLQRVLQFVGGRALPALSALSFARLSLRAMQVNVDCGALFLIPSLRTVTSRDINICVASERLFQTRLKELYGIPDSIWPSP
ncbi:hypothetical protein [Actinopolymorpha pittospori]|uniref:Secreted protein n=1 Tax=Actinopolymorpha pittospori TaxID=648752 RepID=A0A927MSU1_9ACTN|nr:hypothetical protein [Actinopolymorpha pittospori]MBE1606261.1 hypothetical protein [Actinopolymorpha pittospori]